MDASLYCGLPWQRQHLLYTLQSLHVPPGEQACIVVHSSGAMHLENNCTIQGLTCIGRSENNVGCEVKQGKAIFHCSVEDCLSLHHTVWRTELQCHQDMAASQETKLP